MPDTVLADFVGTIFTESGPRADPSKGRVLVNDSQIVLVGSDDQITIRLSDVFDINSGFTPRDMGPFPGTPVTIAYQSGSSRLVAVISSEQSTVEKFQTVLFNALLSDKPVTVMHPARVGGRVTDASFEPGRLSLAGNSLSVESADESVVIDHTAVIDFSRTNRQIDGQTRTTLSVRHMDDGTGQTTHIGTQTPRTSSLLGRYLRRRYDRLIESLDDVSLSKDGIEALTTIYAVGGTPARLVSVLDDDPGAVKSLVSRLGTEGLVRSGSSGFELTTKGQVVVNHYMAKIN